LGEAVARTLSIPWSDLDPIVLDQLGCQSVSEAFERHGEAAWRKVEAEALVAALDEPGPGVLSLGGGVPTSPRAASAIRHAQARRRAVVALLHPGEGELVRRLAAGRGDRPRLGEGDADEVRRLASSRLPLYRSLADAVVDTRRPPPECVDALSWLMLRGRGSVPEHPPVG